MYTSTYIHIPHGIRSSSSSHLAAAAAAAVTSVLAPRTPAHSSSSSSSSSSGRLAKQNQHHLLMLPLLMLLLLAPQLRAAHAHPEPHPKRVFPIDRVRVLLEGGVRIALNTTTLTAAEQPVEVVVTGVAKPQASDLLAVYVPALADPMRVIPVRWVALSAADANYTATGTARAVLRLPNHRADLRVRLLLGGGNLPGGTGPPVIVAGESAPVRNAIVAAPTQGHLGLDDAGRYVVGWVSGARQGQAVRWAIVPEAAPSPLRPSTRPLPALGELAPSVSPATYSAADMCGAPANSTGWIDPGWLHAVVVPRVVPPGARLWYRFGSDAGGWSKLYSAAGQPNRGARARVLVFNDVGMTSPVLFNSACPPYCPGGFNFVDGYASNSSKLARMLPSEVADAALLVGDVSYAQGFAADWDVFGQQFEASFTRWPVLFGTGNHEANWPGHDVFDGLSSDSGGECNVPFTRRFVRPGPNQGDPSTSYFSFNVGCIHFLILDSERPSGPGTPQRLFAERDLRAVDRAATPFVVCLMHRMMVAPSVDARPVIGDVAVMARLRADYEDLFLRHGVDLVVSGHEHAYARTCPMAKGKCVAGGAGGITYVLAGNAGAGFTHTMGLPHLPPWVRVGIEDLSGFVRLTGDAAAGLSVEAVGTDGGSVFDSVRIPARAQRSQAGG